MRLRFTFERWNGNGFPTHASGEAIPLAMRVVHLSQDMEAIGRLFSPAKAIDAARDRRDRTYDPALADLFVDAWTRLVRQAREMEPWDAVLDLEPEPRRLLDGEELDNALTVAADFIDLKSPYMGGHSRRCARVEQPTPPGVLGLDEDAVTTAAPGRAGARLRHDRRAELDLGQARPAHAAGVRPRRASSDADRADAAPLGGPGSAEPGRLGAPREVRRLRLPQARAAPITDDPGACVLAATEIYVGMTTERADRLPFSPTDAAAELRRLASQGVLEQRATQCRARGCRSRRDKSALAQPSAESRRALPARSRCAATRGQGTHDAGDRRPALHLAQDRRSPHPAHLQQDQRLDSRRRCAMGDAKRCRPVSGRI